MTIEVQKSWGTKIVNKIGASSLGRRAIWAPSKISSCGLYQSLFSYIIISDTTKSNKYDNVVVSLGVQEQHQLLMAKAIRHQVVEKLWEITEKLNILYKDNWTALADREMVKFQTELFAQQKHELDFADDSYNEPSIEVRSDQEPPKTMRSRDEWSFASSFLYSLTLITTVGKDLFTITLQQYLVFVRSTLMCSIIVSEKTKKIRETISSRLLCKLV